MILFSEMLVSIFPLVLTIICVVICIYGVNRFLFHRQANVIHDQNFSRHIVMIVLYAASTVAVILALPINEHLQTQMLSLLGVLVSGVIAFSSTTIVSNSMAGIMLRITQPFKTGDFIQVESYFGRITEWGLLDTEIQTEFRELVALPNSYLISHPVTVIRSSGTVVSANLSLGYDVHHSHIRSLLIQAAEEAGLSEPFVQITELGNHSVSYRVNGLLKEVKSLLTTRSNLFQHVLDTLHNHNVEIVSPNFNNMRQMDPNQQIIPVTIAKKDYEINGQSQAEQIVFDKAEQAEMREKTIKQLQENILELKEQIKTASENKREQLTAVIQKKEEQIKEIQITTDDNK